MASFSTYLDILPTPDIKIGRAGQQSSTGSAGPGYASVKIDAEFQTSIDRTNSGRLVSRSLGSHSWKVDISYNPMTRIEFSPVYSFLLEKQGRLRPFFVTLPQYSESQNPNFNISPVDTLGLLNGTDLDYTISPAKSGYAAGRTYFLVDGYLGGTTGAPYPGDMFNIVDSFNSNHTKAYKITRVETSTDYNSSLGSPPTSQRLRIHFSPPLQRFTSNDATINLIDPKIKVIMTNDIVSYQLKTDNLYVFSLNLEEVQ